MARPELCVLLILLLPLAAAVTDPEGDTAQRFGGEPVSAPPVDIRNVTASLADGVLSLRLETWGLLAIGDQASDQDPDRAYVYLFIVAFGARPDANLYEHVAGGGDSLTAICTYHEGMLDLACQVTQGDAVLRASGATGRNLTVRFAVEASGSLAVGGSSHLSIPNGTEREIIAQDFTANALPYQGVPGAGVGATESSGEAPRKPWWRTGWAAGAALAVGLGLIGLTRPWERLRGKGPR